MGKRKAPVSEIITPAIYVRVSTQEQADSGLGLAAQETRCTAQIAAKGWDGARVYRDEGISGTLGRDKRPGLDALLTAVERGEINAIIVLDLSRLGRSVRLVTEMIEQFESAGVTFVSCKESFDTSTAMGKAMLGLVAVFGQLERDLTSERTIAALDELKKQGRYSGGRIPFGYTLVTHELVEIDTTAAATVRRIFALRDDQGLSMDKIAQQLNSTATPTAQGGVRWYASSVKAILDNRSIYQGGAVVWPKIL